MHQAYRVDTDLLYLISPGMGPWAVVRRLRFGDETWYRAVTFREDPKLRVLVGYSRALRAGVKAACSHHLHNRTNTGSVDR